jgi:hypothetical protein
MRGRLLALAAIVVSAGAFAGQAAAVKPEVIVQERFDPSLTLRDPDLSAACGFDVFVSMKGHFSTKLFFNKEGEVTRVVSHPSFATTFTANGNTITSADRGVDKVVFNPDGTLSIFGTGIHLKIKGEVSAIGLWRLVFDPSTGELIDEEYHGNFDLEADEILDYLCSRLAPEPE